MIGTYVFDSWGPGKDEKTYVVMCDDCTFAPISTKHNPAEAESVAKAHAKAFHS